MVHNANVYLDWPAGGWSSDPVIICVENSAPDSVKSTILHEAGHNPLLGKLTDIKDSRTTANATSIMHFQNGAKRNCFRYLPRPLEYHNPDGTKEENQWEKIPRP
jgi:hypothetical protein